jgi:hypothetical protein
MISTSNGKIGKVGQQYHDMKKRAIAPEKLRQGWFTSTQPIAGNALCKLEVAVYKAFL